MLVTTVIAPAEITGVNVDNRTLDIAWIGHPGGVRSVKIVSDAGDFSMPKTGEVGLVIQHETQAYFLGKIEYGYKQKIDRQVYDPNNEKIVYPAKRVSEGEVCTASPLNDLWLSMANSGDFGFSNGVINGLRYYASREKLQLKGKLLALLGNGITAKLGSVLRDVTGMDDPVAEVPLFPAIEALIDLIFMQVRLARLHIGHVKNNKGIDERSTFGGKLRAVLETAAGLPGNPVMSASLKFDDSGNIELTSLLGKIAINSSNAIGSILLGGLAAAQKAVFGDALLLWLNTHTHPTLVGPSGPPTVQATQSLLSQKVMIG
jgi:hypothetical protein